MIELEIDGQKVTANDGDMIIEVADRYGIYIPRYCYHKKLSIAANCRMCLVEVENSRKPMPACATPVMPDMKVFTKSKAALESQRAVMEFLLINHPLDCPICDQGGECELQDLAMGYGSAYSNYDEPKNCVADEDIGPLIDTHMTRCIKCTRCVRFGDEIAGMRELGVIHRSEQSEISTYIKHFLQSELSGNIIDICPVGALTHKPSRYGERSWQLTEHHSIAPHDCVGSNIYVHSKARQLFPDRKIMRVVPRENETINESWLADRDRFSYQGLHSDARLLHPRRKHNGQWQDCQWKAVLLEIADKTLAIQQNDSADELALLASPNGTIEEFYVMQKFMRTLGSNNIDHRLREQDFSDQDELLAYPNLGMQIDDIETLDRILLVGSYVRHEQPILSHRMNKAAEDGAVMMAVNPVDHTFIFPLQHKIIARDMIAELQHIATALEGSSDVPDAAKHIADQLKSGEKAAIFMGAFAIQHPQAATIRKLLRYIAKLSDANVGVLSEGANSAGAWLAGMLPHRGPAAAALPTPGKDAMSLLTTAPKKIYFIVNFEPEFDCAYSAAAIKTLDEAAMVVCVTPFVTATMETYADYILPMTPFTETNGSFVNCEGVWQKFKAVSVPKGDAKPAWKIFRVLANFMQLDGFDFKNVHAVHQELQSLIDTMDFKTSGAEPTQVDVKNEQGAEFLRLASWPIYRIDNLVRRATALQETGLNGEACIALNKKDAAQLQLTAGQKVTASQADASVTLPLVIDDRLADGLVYLPSALAETAGFGQHLAAIRVRAAA